MAITGTTGMASLNYNGGTTIHHWLGLGDGRLEAEELSSRILHEDRYLEVRNRICTHDVLVVDEIGMLSQRLFEQSELVCRTVRRSQVIFGGLQVIVAGDFKQLAPVPNHRYSDPGDFCFKSDLFQEAFLHRHHLTEVHFLITKVKWHTKVDRYAFSDHLFLL